VMINKICGSEKSTWYTTRSYDRAINDLIGKRNYYDYLPKCRSGADAERITVLEDQKNCHRFITTVLRSPVARIDFRLSSSYAGGASSRVASSLTCRCNAEDV